MKRPTPHLEAWRAGLRAWLDAERGRQQQLAEHLAASTGRTADGMAPWLNRVLAGAVVPNGEDLLCIEAWRLKRRGEVPKPAGRRKPDGPAARGTRAR